jgi:hypothetical protein
MDYATYTAYEKYGAWTDDRGRPIPCARRRNLTELTAEERRLYLRITDPAWTRVRRVGQERIPLDVAAAHLTAVKPR